MTRTEEILYILSNYPGGYKLIRARLRGYTGPIHRGHKQNTATLTDNTLFATLSRLKRNGLLKNDERRWTVTEKGLAFLKKLKHRQNKPNIHPGAKNMVVSFDIPEKLKGRRDWLRNELIQMDFLMIQKSVWFGKAPLPKEFIEKLHAYKLLGYIKFFRATEWDIV